MFKQTGNGETEKFSFIVLNQADLDAAIVAGLLTEIGLGGISLLKKFNAEEYNGNLFLVLLETVRSDRKLLAFHINDAKKNGQTTIGFIVPISLLGKIRNFLARLTDAAKQFVESDFDTARGALMNITEGAKDMIDGSLTAADGVFQGMTTPVGSEGFKEGWKKAGAGAGQYFAGQGKIAGQTLVDALLMKGGKIIGGWQTLFGLESVGRLLESAERQILAGVFGNSVQLDAIRIKEGYAGILNAGLDNGFTLTNNQRAITIGNTIYMKNNVPVLPNHASTLVHETVHVWQHQNGGTDYMSEALHAQMTSGYGYLNDVLVKPPKKPKSWKALSPEQQAQLIQDAFQAGFFQNKIWNGNADLTNYMNQVLPQLRSGQGAT